MKLAPAATVVSLLVLLLTWLSLRAINTNAELVDHAFAELDRFTMAEAALNRDAFAARAGMLRNYDRLVRDTKALDASLTGLRDAMSGNAEMAAAVERLAVSVARQQELIEQFKSDNALLQNSLAYFGRFSARLDASDEVGPIGPAVSALAAAMLRLTLDTSPDTVRAVEVRLDDLAGQPVSAGDAQAVEALLAHGRLLRDLLPKVDGILKDLCSVPRKQDQAAVRALALANQAASRARARWFRVLLYLTSLVLVGLLVHLGLQLRARARDRAKLEARLQQSRRMEAMGALACGIAHNFNNIVGAIMGYAEMAEAQAAAGSRLAGHLGEIRWAGARARDLTDQILTFGRRRDAHRRPVSVGALLDETASLLRASLPPGIDLEIRDRSARMAVAAEPAQLQQVILNLCINAAQAMDGTGRVEVDAQVHGVPRAMLVSHGQLAPGRYVCLAVSDTGRGMDDATLERLFEPFFTTRSAGNGLGLATVREIVAEHGGAMNVRSVRGAGSRFEAWLPCSAVAEPPRAEALPLRLGNGETLLLVGDNREQRLRDEEILAALGYEPVGFSRAEDAVAACRKAPDRFDAMMVGHLVSTSAALGLACRLHRLAPRLPILLTVSSGIEIDADTLMKAGIAEVVSRPLVTTEIAAALARYLGPLSRHPGGPATRRVTGEMVA